MAYTKRVRRILKACFKRQIELTSSGWSRTNENAEYRAILDRCWSDASQNYSRDLALEAFEDGHPHVVYA